MKKDDTKTQVRWDRAAKSMGSPAAIELRRLQIIPPAERSQGRGLVGLELQGRFQ